VREGINLGGRLNIVVDVGEAGQRVGSLDVHGAGSADSLPAGSSKGEGGILLVLDLDEGVEDHGSAVVEIDGIGAQIGLLVVLFGVPPVDLKVFDALFGGRLRVRIDGALEIGFGGRQASLYCLV